MSEYDDPRVDPISDHVAEQELIGGMLRQPSLTPDVLGEVTPDALTHPLASSAFTAFQHLVGEGTPQVTSSLLRTELITTHRHAPEVVALWIGEAAQAAPLTADELHAVATRVQKLRDRRGLRDGLVRVQASNADPASDPLDTLGELDALVTELRTGGSAADSVHGGEDVLAETLDLILGDDTSVSNFIPTGSTDLDRIFNGGFETGRVYQLGGRPGAGKSLSGSDFTRAALRAGAGAIYITLEMPASEVMIRMLSAEALIDSARLRSKSLGADETERLAAAAGKLHWGNLALVDQPNITVEAVGTIVAHQALQLRANGVKNVLVVLDYVQIMGDSPGLSRNTSRQQMLGHISKALKTIARAQSVPIVSLAQLDRGTDTRPPTMSDLREAGDLEMNADAVVLLHTPSSADPEDRPGETDFIIAKNRGGEAHIVITRAPRFKYSRFDDLRFN